MPTSLHRQRIDAKQQRGTQRLADTAARVRQGEVTAVSPLEVELAGSGVSSEMVALLGQRLAVGDKVQVLRWGSTGFVLGKVSADPRGAAAGTLDVSTTGNKSVTSLDFKPSLVRFFPLVPSSTATANIGEGVMTEDHQSSVGIAVASSGSNIARESRTDACIILASSSGGLAFRAVRASLNSDGFTINVTTASAAVPSLTWQAYA